MSGYKIDVVHTVLDVTTGEAKEVANNFIATKIFTNATENINTFINLQTRVLESSMFGYTLLEGIEMKDGYILAETQAFANGALQDNTAFAILDANTLQKVAELPKIVDSQFGYIGFITEHEMLVNVRTADNQILRYTANTQTGDLELFVKSSQSITYLKGDAFVVGRLGSGSEKLYDFEWNEIGLSNQGNSFAELMGSKKQITLLPDGKLLTYYLYESGDGYNTYISQSWNLGEVVYDSYFGKKIYKETLIYSNTSYSGERASLDYYENGNFYVYSRAGEIKEVFYLTDSGSTMTILEDLSPSDVTIYEKDNSSKYVTHNVNYVIEDITELADGTYFVTVAYKTTYDEFGYKGGYRFTYTDPELGTLQDYPSDEVKASRTYYQYYIIK